MFYFVYLMHLAYADAMISFAEVVDSESNLREKGNNEDTIRVRWPFCSSYPDSCATHLWVDIEVNIDGYIQRRNADHDSWFDIIQETKKDMQPLAQALQRYFRKKGISTTSEQAGIIQGMIQSVHYAYDNCDSRNPESNCNAAESTGWTEYPKYGIEFIVDQKGDCEDAAIISSSLFDDVGMEAWLVYWDSHDNGMAHASTALSLSQGDLQKVSLPRGSEYVVHPKKNTPLLSADSVGSLQGCSFGCAPLGWNEWPKQNLFVVNAWKTDDKSIDDTFGGAWTKEDGVFKQFKSDRRKDSREKITSELHTNQEKWDENTRKRLSKLEVKPEKIDTIVKKANPYKQSTDEGWVFLILVCTGILSMVGYAIFVQRKERKLRVQELQDLDKKSKF